MLRPVLLFSLLFVCCFATPVKYKDCGSKKGVVHLVDVSPCASQPCPLKMDSNITFKLDFLTKSATKAVTLSADGTDSYGMDVEIDLDDTNACDMGVTCPVKAGNHNVLSLNYYVPYDQEMDLTLKVELMDDANDDIACVQVPLKLVSELPDTKLRFKPSS